METCPKRRHLSHPTPSHTAMPERIADIVPLRGRNFYPRAVPALLWFSVLLSILAISAQGQGICDRTRRVHIELAELSGRDHCGQVTPQDLARIKTVNLRGRRLSVLRSHDFSGLVSLEVLYLTDNDLTELPEGIFQELGNLKSLSLARNSLTGLREEVFQELGSLAWLIMGYNPLTSIPEGIFRGFGRLETLALNDTSLTALPDGIFQTLGNLKTLYLDRNPLTRLPKQIFDGLIKLETLHCTGTALSTLPAGIFGDQSAVKSLYLSENRLTRLPNGVFNGLDELVFLDLDGNQLSQLPERVFNGLSKLYRLWLRNNSLTLLPAKLFHGLDNLNSLRLESNSRITFASGVFDDVLDTLAYEGVRIDSENKGILSFAPTSQIAAEGETVRVTVTLSRPLPLALRVRFSVKGDASMKYDYRILFPDPEADYEDAGLLFLAGETSKDIELSLIQDGDTKVETILFTLPFSMDLYRSDGTGEKAPRLDAHSLAYRSDLDNRHVVTIVSGPLPSGFAPKDPSRFTEWAVGKQLTWYENEVFFRDGIRFRYERGRFGDFTGRNYSTGSYSYRSEGPHVGTVVLSYDGGRYDELQITFVSETTGVILHKSLQFETFLVKFILELQETPAFVPVILKSAGRNRSFYTSEMTLTNRWSEQARLKYTYTAHFGEGSGIASEVLGPGQQRVVPDAIAYLKTLGLPIHDSGNRLGTLKVEVEGVADVGVVIRTTTLVSDGRAGLAYPGVAPGGGFYRNDVVHLLGLRRNSQDRSNVALQHMGMSEQPVTLRTTVYSADPGDDRHTVMDDLTLQPREFHQYNDILAATGYENGYVTVQSVGPRETFDSRFYAYGVINDNFNSDGSFVLPTIVPENPVYLDGRMEESATVIVETGSFNSELTVTNLGYSDGDNILNFSFVSDQIQTADHTAEFNLTLEKGEQRIVSNIVGELRRQEVEGIGPRGRAHIGTLFIDPIQEGHRVVISVRTGSPDGRGGQYGVSYNAIKLRSAFRDSAWICGLQQNAENRSNLALVNTGVVDENDIVFEIDIYDGVTGNLVNTVRKVTVPARRWHQIDAILAKHAPGTTQGYVQIRTVSGKNSFLAYAVINDGAAPGQRSGDGAYLAAQD